MEWLDDVRWALQGVTRAHPRSLAVILEAVDYRQRVVLSDAELAACIAALLAEGAICEVAPGVYCEADGGPSIPPTAVTHAVWAAAAQAYHTDFARRVAALDDEELEFDRAVVAVRWRLPHAGSPGDADETAVEAFLAPLAAALAAHGWGELEGGFLAGPGTVDVTIYGADDTAHDDAIVALCRTRLHAHPAPPGSCLLRIADGQEFESDHVPGASPA